MKVGWKATPLDRLADAYVVATPSETRSKQALTVLMKCSQRTLESLASPERLRENVSGLLIPGRSSSRFSQANRWSL